MLLNFLLIFLIGVAASPCWVASCAGLVLGLRSFPAADRGLGRQLCYNAGRVVAYGLLGAAAGALGSLVPAAGQEVDRLSVAAFDQGALALAAGGFMIAMAALIAARPWTVPSRATARMTRLVPRVVRSRSPLGPLGLGVLCGLLPCPLVYAMIALSTLTGSPTTGMAVMLAFGLGTLPLALSAGLSGDRPVDAWTREGARLSSRLVGLLALASLAQGVLG